VDDSSVVRASYLGTIGATQIVNTLHYVVKHDSAYAGGDDAGAMADQIDTKLTTAYRAVCPVGMTVDTLVVREELAAGDTSIPEEGAKSIGLAGTLANADTLLPLGLCMHLKIKTNAAVRSGHGGIFLPPPRVSTSLASQGFFASAASYYVNAGTLAALLDDNIQVTSGGFNTWHLSPVVYSRTRRNRADPNWYFGVTQVQRDFTPHWLRSRMTAP
jgi:hypothetical protein